jgi:hypothetical protein
LSLAGGGVHRACRSAVDRVRSSILSLDLIRIIRARDDRLVHIGEVDHDDASARRPEPVSSFRSEPVRCTEPNPFVIRTASIVIPNRR